MEKQLERQTYGHGGRKGGRRGDIWREYIEIYNTMCKIDSQWEFAAWLGNSNRGSKIGWSVGREMRGRSRRQGTWVYLWLILDVWQKTTKFCKAIILHLKKKKSMFVKQKCFQSFWSNMEAFNKGENMERCKLTTYCRVCTTHTTYTSLSQALRCSKTVPYHLFLQCHFKKQPEVSWIRLIYSYPQSLCIIKLDMSCIKALDHCTIRSPLILGYCSINSK